MRVWILLVGTLHLLCNATLLLAYTRVSPLFVRYPCRERFHKIHPNSSKQSDRAQSMPSSLHMSQQYDVTRPVFDLYAFRTIRGDALTKYNSLNQSEPLRINLSLLLCFTFACSPFLAKEIDVAPFTLSQFGLAATGAVASASVFVKECQRRSRQLNRLEKELDALSLRIRLPTNQFADQAYQKPQSIMMALKSKNCRLIAITGSTETLRNSILMFCILRKRLQQANTYVVVIPTDNENFIQEVIQSAMNDRYTPWLAEATDRDSWKEYFETLSDDDDSSFRWFGLSPTGRSFGSGRTEPSWIEVLGKNLLPVEILDDTESNEISQSSVINEILSCQGKFYDALTNGKLADMHRLFDKENEDEAVSAIVSQGGRLDAWEQCLADGARPAGMKISGCDGWRVDETTAYSTCIEFPIEQNGTLLAIQKWNYKKDGWLLQKHQTIPWTTDLPAAGTLICDLRGCVSLVRTKR